LCSGDCHGAFIRLTFPLKYALIAHVSGGRKMNKSELVAALADRLGDRKTATTAVDEFVEIIIRTVHSGEKVSITGFGVFEKRDRKARNARNPRTGEAVKVKKTSVPAFRAGQGFKDVVSGSKKIAKPTKASKSPAKAKTTKAAAKPKAKPAAKTKPTAKKAVKRTTAKKK
jgi:DNA-binding protein HU-beta